MCRATVSDFEQCLLQTPPSSYTVQALSAALQLSERQLRRYTRQLFGLTPRQWLDLQRVLRSLPLLQARRCVKLVFEMAGFRQASHFSRLFKLFLGFPPKAWLRLAPRRRDDVSSLYLAAAPERRQDALCLSRTPKMADLDTKWPIQIQNGRFRYK
jgi:AraC-like DNA-binding protein